MRIEQEGDPAVQRMEQCVPVPCVEVLRKLAVFPVVRPVQIDERKSVAQAHDARESDQEPERTHTAPVIVHGAPPGVTSVPAPRCRGS